MVHHKTRLVIENIEGYIEKTVNKYGTGAKVDCPKVYLGKRVILVILKDEQPPS